MTKKRVFTTFIILILICTGLIFVTKLDYEKNINIPNSETTQKVTLKVETGQSVDTILNNLIEKGVLKKKNYYYSKVYLKLNKLETKIQAGTYYIPQNLTIKELFDTLQNAKEQDIWVTIPEGIRVDEIGKIFEKDLATTMFSYDKFISLSTDATYISTLGLIEGVTNLEGFLFPDKYAFPPNATTELVIEKMIANFKKRTDNMTIKYQDIIMASIVEREGYNAQDKPIIAGIILKRLQEGWFLQTDATLLYPLKDWKHVITKADIDNSSPYNTYKNIGLPPTPICNPGLQSILAVKNPQKSAYYYYIHDNQGNPHYGKDLAEHNANIEKYLR